MLITLHKKMPVTEQEYLEDIHKISLVSHAVYQLDCGISVKTYISFFLYAKSVYLFSQENN